MISKILTPETIKEVDLQEYLIIARFYLDKDKQKNYILIMIDGEYYFKDPNSNNWLTSALTIPEVIEKASEHGALIELFKYENL